MKKHLEILSMYAMAAAMFQDSNPIRPEDINVKPKKKIIPKGCKEYFFFENGSYQNTPDEQIVFNCIASSEKRAYQKFETYKLTLK